MSLLHRFSRSDDGNVAIIFALAMIPIISCAGMGVDYTLAGRRQSSINAIADAAALSTTTPAAMALTSSQAQTNAQSMFNAQINGIVGINFAASNLVIMVTDTSTTTSTVRNTTVTYTATSKNAFSGILRMPTMPIGGIAKASNTNAPNIDFYLLIDTSPSMGIPSSQPGIDKMVASTPQQLGGGCAFACHESNPSAGDVQGNPKGPNGQPEDNYALARQLGITLRMDLVQQAAANLISTAASTEAVNNAIYRVATYTFDAAFNTITNLTPNLTLAQSGQTSNAYSDASTKINMLEVASNSYLTPIYNNNDQDTNWDGAMAYTPLIPAPGNGTKALLDTPKEILFIVTDGVTDELYPNSGSMIYTDNNNRTVAPTGFQHDWCTPLKNRGVQIAILYTTYYPLPSSGYYTQTVDHFHSSISSTLNACASSGLFFEVDTGGDINAAMQKLFATAVSSASAHLTQ